MDDKCCLTFCISPVSKSLVSKYDNEPVTSPIPQPHSSQVLVPNVDDNKYQSALFLSDFIVFTISNAPLSKGSHPSAALNMSETFDCASASENVPIQHTRDRYTNGYWYDPYAIFC